MFNQKQKASKIDVEGLKDRTHRVEMIWGSDNTDYNLTVYGTKKDMLNLYDDIQDKWSKNHCDELYEVRLQEGGDLSKETIQIGRIVSVRIYENVVGE